VVLRPGWWEEYDASQGETTPASESALLGAQSDVPEVAGDVADDAQDDGLPGESDLVDEEDRMRCIALALELWGPAEYPFVGELTEVPNRTAGPAIAVTFA
jgi:hypothetical protein